MDDNLSKSSMSQTKKKMFLIKKKVGEDNVKNMKHMTQLPGLPNYLIQASTVSQLGKPTSSQDQKRLKDSKMKPNQSFSNQSKGPQTLKSSEIINDQTNAVNDLTEIGERSQAGEEEEQLNLHQIEGPQLKMEKDYISFSTYTEQTGFDNVTVWNNGSASIYYEWKRIHNTRQSQNAIQDVNEERFFCHHEQNVIKPAERIRFVFSFLSKITGIFSEEWQLKCEPPTIEPLPNLKLKGIASRDDEAIDWRKYYDQEIKLEYTHKQVEEVVQDILLNVRTPTPPPPNLEDSEQCKIEFEELNLSERLWYSPEVVNLFKFTHQELVNALQLKGEEAEWNLDVQQLKNLIQNIEEDDEKELIERKLYLWLKFAKKQPITKSNIYHTVRGMILDTVYEVPALSEAVRKELDMWEYNFKVPSEQDPTPEEIKQKNDEINKIKAEWLKRTKKKKWTEENEKEMIEDYKKKFSERVANQLCQYADILDNEGELLRVQSLINYDLKWNVYRRMRFDESYLDYWMRKKTIIDADIEGKKITIRFHLKLAKVANVKELKQQFEEELLKEKFEEEKRLEEERLEKERLAKEAAKKKGKGRPQQQQQKQQKQETVEQVQKRKELKHIDQDCLNEIVEMVKNLLERQAKIVVIAVSYDKPYGRYKFESSTKFFYEWLKGQLEQPCYFSESCVIENFDEMMENQIWTENSALVLENLFFEPFETGIIVEENGQTIVPEEPDIEAKTPYRRMMPYAPIYIIADKSNFFSNRLPSISLIQADQNILGTNIARDIQTLFYNINGMKNRIGTVIIGGKISKEKILAIDQLMCLTSNIILLGQVGYAFYCTMNNIEEPRISIGARNVIKELLKCLQQELIVKPPEKLKRIPHVRSEPKPKAKLICPLDFLIATMPANYEPNNQEHVDSIINSVQQYLPSSNENNQKQILLDKQQILLDYGPATIQMVEMELRNSQRVVWIDTGNLSLYEIEKTITVPDHEAIALVEKLKAEQAQRELEMKAKEKKGRKQPKKQEVEEDQMIQNIKTVKEINVKLFNETNRSIGKIFYLMQEEKKQMHSEAQKMGQFQYYNFEQDCVFTLIGEELEARLNDEDFPQLFNGNNFQDEGKEKSEKMANEEQQQEGAEGDGADKQSSISQKEKEKEKINQVKTYLSDFFIKDQDFILKVLSGEHVDCLKNIDEYQKKTNSEIDEEQFFEDDSP